MKPFLYVRPEDEAEAGRLASEKGSSLLGGGTDLVPRLKAGLVDEAEGSRLVSLAGLERPVIERSDGGGLRLPGTATLTQVLDSDLVAERAPILQEAVRDAATPQLRNRATVAGNLLQRSRCGYYRTPDAFADCLLEGGEGCPAREGLHRFHALKADGPCISAHPSDLAPALLALGARLEILEAGGKTRTMNLADLYAEPTPEDRREHRLPRGALVRAVEVPASEAKALEAYRKGMDRAAWSFALASVAVVLEVTGDAVSSAAVWLGAVAPIPYEARAAAESLQGADWKEGAPAPEAVEDAVEAVTEGLESTEQTRYKLRLLRGLLRAALTDEPA